MSFRIGNLCLFGAAVLIFLFGCSSSTDVTYEDGRLYFLNNARHPPEGSPGHYVTDVWVTYEDMVEYRVPFNMDHDGNPTGVGAIELTKHPLPGGTVVKFHYIFNHLNSFREKRDVEVVIDGNVTVEVYMQKWDDPDCTVLWRVIRGRYDGAHFYPEMGK